MPVTCNRNRVIGVTEAAVAFQPVGILLTKGWTIKKKNLDKTATRNRRLQNIDVQIISTPASTTMYSVVIVTQIVTYGHGVDTAAAQNASGAGGSQNFRAWNPLLDVPVCRRCWHPFCRWPPCTGERPRQWQNSWSWRCSSAGWTTRWTRTACRRTSNDRNAFILMVFIFFFFFKRRYC